MRAGLLAAVVAALAVAGAAAAPRAPRVPVAGFARTAHAGGRPSRAALRAVAWRGGPQTTAAGEHVVVYVSTSYAEADADGDPRRWANVFGGFLHGSELASLLAYVATPAEVVELCGGQVGVLGCWNGGRIVLIGEEVDGELPEAVAAHEYGHLVAAHRSNPPWRAVDWGPKRWASAAQVCARAAAGTAFPGDEGGGYELNPGEAFAETYRVLNGTGAVDWPLLDPSFRPDAAALAAAREDVVHPWSAPAARVQRGSFRAGGPRTWTLPLATPLDGDLSLELRLTGAAADTLTLVDGAGKAIGAGGWSQTGRRLLLKRICGRRSVRVVVRRVGPPGSFVLRVSQP